MRHPCQEGASVVRVVAMPCANGSVRSCKAPPFVAVQLIVQSIPELQSAGMKGSICRHCCARHQCFASSCGKHQSLRRMPSLPVAPNTDGETACLQAEVQRRLLKTKAQQQASPHPPTAASPSDSTKCAPAGEGHQQQQGLDSCTVSTRVSQHLVPGPMQASHGAARIPTPGQGRHFVLSVPAPFSQRVRVGQKPPIVTPMEPPADPSEPRELPAHVPPPLSDMTAR